MSVHTIKLQIDAIAVQGKMTKDDAADVIAFFMRNEINFRVEGRMISWQGRDGQHSLTIRSPYPNTSYITADGSLVFLGKHYKEIS